MLERRGQQLIPLSAEVADRIDEGLLGDPWVYRGLEGVGDLGQSQLSQQQSGLEVKRGASTKLFGRLADKET